MDYTQGGEKLKLDRAKKQMLWFGIISLCMTFAGLTSAYIVSMERRDWLENYDFPQALIVSTVLIVISSITIHLAKNAIISGKNSMGTLFLMLTLALGIGFVVSQFAGFSAFQEQGYYFTGASSNITTTFFFLIIAVHIAHLIAGFISLITVIINHLRGKYSAAEHLGLTLGVTFWHFLDILWVFLFVLLFVTK
ncbi:cytochrome c oxidase subunit 3 [uncultured Dokdonia sp.]|jgi:cytochrome c oxidase subunit 3|uniref:cytochrome c oxidase subunit 3 n=1 Tax=unclassified Dokdonia TaxID=2615033 RepID=UPI00262278D0|nr:cytochrome c oxidase subunit 3 [uncultured Dokdonia sp.]|tara:strand:- start:12601 stop:13182 length:582 start_codon:yes stop_codon:yes gene_type:complete